MNIRTKKVKATVYCSKCDAHFDTTAVITLNIEEGPQGEDICTFKCPLCKQERKSQVRASR